MFLLLYFVQWIKNEEADHWHGYLYTILFGTMTWASSILRSLNFFYSSVVGVVIRKGISGVIYRKILRFNQKSKAKASAGKLVSIISGDLQMIERGLMTAASLATSPILLVIWTILLYFIFGEGAFIGLAAGVLVILCIYFLSGYIRKYKYKEGYYSDKRLKTLSDVINGIRTIKAYAWERPFYKLINKFRSQMVKYTFRLELLDSIMWAIGWSGGYLMALFMFLYHYEMGREFSYEHSIAAIGIWSYTIIVIYQPVFLAINGFKTFLAVLKRVGEILDMEEFNSNIDQNEDDYKIEEDACIKIDQASLTWGFSIKKDLQNKDQIDDQSNDINLQDINFVASSTDLVAVVGEVGSGKSTFLSVIMKELKIVNGSVSVPFIKPFIDQYKGNNSICGARTIHNIRNCQRKHFAW